jgi:hypothetical protein
MRGAQAALMVLRPVLPPGADVVRRDARTLVVGVRPGLVVPDRPGLVPLLRLLDGRTLDGVVERAAVRVPELGGAAREVLLDLVGRGALLPGPPPPPPRLSARVQPWSGSERVARVVAGAVDDLALRPDPDGRAGLLVLVAAGEPDRLWVAQAEESGLLVLPVVLAGAWGRVGPLTLPGRTACLGCHDAARGAWDPTWSTAGARWGRPLVTAPPPHPPTGLVHRVAAVAAEQVLACAGATRPDSVGAVLHVAGHDVVREPVGLHPACPSLLHRDA